MSVREAEPSELDALAARWHEGWNDAHAVIAPPGLVRARTLESFRDRLAAVFADIRVVGPSGAPLGLCVVKDDELYQIFVARQARGTGVAAALLADGETRLAGRGVATAWLSCAVGNHRAARFYEKRGWYRARSFMNRLETQDGVFELEMWRYEKRVAS